MCRACQLTCICSRSSSPSRAAHSQALRAQPRNERKRAKARGGKRQRSRRQHAAVALSHRSAGTRLRDQCRCWRERGSVDGVVGPARASVWTLWNRGARRATRGPRAQLAWHVGVSVFPWRGALLQRPCVRTGLAAWSRCIGASLPARALQTKCHRRRHSRDEMVTRACAPTGLGSQ